MCVCVCVAPFLWLNWWQTRPARQTKNDRKKRCRLRALPPSHFPHKQLYRFVGYYGWFPVEHFGRFYLLYISSCLFSRQEKKVTIFFISLSNKFRKWMMSHPGRVKFGRGGGSRPCQTITSWKEAKNRRLFRPISFLSSVDFQFGNKPWERPHFSRMLLLLAVDRFCLFLPNQSRTLVLIRFRRPIFDCFFFVFLPIVCLSISRNQIKSRGNRMCDVAQSSQALEVSGFAWCPSFFNSLHYL